MIVLLGGELENGRDVIGFEVGIVGQYLFACGAGSKQVEYVLYADTKPTNGRSASAYVGTDGYPVKGHEDILARRNQSGAAAPRRYSGQARDPLGR